MIGGELMFFELDLTSGSLDRSPRLDELFGFEPGDAGDDVQTFVDRIISGDRDIVEGQLGDARSKPPHTLVRLDYRVIRPGGEMIWVTARTETIGGMPDGGSARLTGVVLDVTDLRRSEAELRDTLKARDDLVAQKEILLGEVHHRIKNSLQIVCSILALDARMADEEAMQDRLHRAAARVMAVASVHELIYKAGQVTTVELEDYLVDLCRSLEASGPTAVLCHAEPLRLSTDKAISLALLINELVSNAFKHAFAGRVDGQVTVTCVREGSAFVLIVSDNGSGKPHSSTPGLGTTVVAAMVAQLGGTITEGAPTGGSKSGYETLIRAPIQD
jgi:PAS domain S-box-containing protein